jgi:hypothetical protein
MSETLPIHLSVNGHLREGHCEARKLLVDFLREDLGLDGRCGTSPGVAGAAEVLWRAAGQIGAHRLHPSSSTPRTPSACAACRT